MSTDIKDISPVEDKITFSDNSGNVYTLPGKIPSYLSLIMADMWEGLSPLITVMGVPAKERFKALEKISVESGKDPMVILKEVDLQAREIVAMLAKEHYPHIDAEWIENNVPDDQFHILAVEVLQKATSFFLSRIGNMEHVMKGSEALEAQHKALTRKLGSG